MSEGHSDRLVRNSIISFCNSCLGLVLSFTVSILTMRMLGPERYGIYSIVLWLMSLVSLAVGMGFNFGLTKFVSEYQGRAQAEAVQQIIRFVLWIELAFAMVALTILLMLRTQIADYFFNPDYVLIFTISFFGLLPGVLTAVYSSVLEGIQKFRYFLYYSAVVSPISLGTKVFVLLRFGTVESLLYVSLAFSFINAAFYRWAIHHYGIRAGLIGKPPPSSLRKKIIRYNFQVMLIMFLDKFVHDKSENFFLGRFCPAIQAGFFNVAYGLSNRFVTIISSTFWKVLFPFMSERMGADDQSRINRAFYLSTRYLAFIAFPIAAGGIVLAWPLIKYALGPQYIPAQRALQIFFFTTMFGCLAIPQASVLYAVNRQHFIIKYGAFLALVNIALDILLIPKHGALGAAIANGSIKVLAYIGGITYTLRVTQVRLPLKSLFKICYSAILMAVVMQVIIKLNNEFMGFIVSIPAGIIVYLGNSIYVGTFEKEDARVLRKFTSVLPNRLQACLGLLHRRVEGKNSIEEAKDF